MAKAVVTSCDMCGQSGDDVRTYTIRVDGVAWEVDLDDKHAEAVLKVARKGRQMDNGVRHRGVHGLERRIRGVPQVQEG